MTFEETLAEWMPSQRWFAGKGARILDLAIVTDTELVGGDPGLHQLIVTVTQSTAVLRTDIESPGTLGATLVQGSTVDSYQLFLGLREELPNHLQHVLVGVADDGRIAYDALHDPELTRLLLQAIAEGGRAGPLCFAHEPGAVSDRFKRTRKDDVFAGIPVARGKRGFRANNSRNLISGGAWPPGARNAG